MEKEIISGIYKITNKINGKVYIGKSKNIFERWKQHKRELNSKTHINKSLQEDWDIYGEDNLIFKIIENINGKEELAKAEQKWINYYNSNNLKIGYNIATAHNEKKKQKINKKTTSSKIILEEIINNSTKHPNMNFNDDIIKIYYNEINKNLKQNKINILDIELFFMIIPFLEKDTNILIDSNGDCLNRQGLSEKIGYAPESISRRIKILYKYNFLKSYKKGKNIYYIINPKYAHNGFYIYNEVEKLFK